MKKILKSRKGNEPTAASAGVVVILIAGLIIFYLLWISPTERAELLGENSTDSDGDGIDDENDNYDLLLQENIGRLMKLPYSEREHDLSAISVSTKVSAEELKHFDTLYARNSVFTKKFPEIRFTIDSDITKNLKLSFNLEQSQGILMIYLNGNEIFAGEILQQSPPAIELPDEYIQDMNTLSFYIYRPSWAFWQINEYRMKDVKVLGDVTDYSNNAGEIDFQMSSIEFANIDESTFFFFPDCELDKVGKLTITLNGQKIFSAIPDCGIQNYVVLNPLNLQPSQNTLGFKTEKGYYLLDQIRIKNELKAQIYPIHYFDLKDEYFEDDDYGNPEFKEKYYDVNITLRFVDDSWKNLKLWINGFQRQITSRETEYKLNLDSFVLPKSNSLELIPANDDINVAEIKVELFEVD